MKQILLIIIITLSVLSCKAQHPIIPLYNGSDYLETQNAYYKDVDGDLQKLVGNWKYSNGNELFEVVLMIQRLYFNNDVDDISFYEDIIYGEYKYVDQNGVEVLNTLNQIDSNSDPYEHSIYGGYIKDIYDLPVCDDCNPNERRVVVVIEDPLRYYFDYDMIIRHLPGEEVLDIPERIKISVKRASTAIVPENEPDNDRIDFEELILVKQ